MFSSPRNKLSVIRECPIETSAKSEIFSLKNLIFFKDKSWPAFIRIPDFEISEAQKFKRDAQWEKEKEGANVARMILFWPALATTFANAEKAMKAADDRSYHIIKLMDKKNCSGVDTVRAEINKFSTNNVAAQLREVRDMYKSGDLTKKEFKKAKKKILDLK